MLTEFVCSCFNCIDMKLRHLFFHLFTLKNEECQEFKIKYFKFSLCMQCVNIINEIKLRFSEEVNTLLFLKCPPQVNKMVTNQF